MGPGTDVCVNVTKQGQHETKTLFILCSNSHKRESLYKATAGWDSSKDLLLTGRSRAVSRKTMPVTGLQSVKRIITTDPTGPHASGKAAHYWPRVSRLTSLGWFPSLHKEGLDKTPTSHLALWLIQILKRFWETVWLAQHKSMNASEVLEGALPWGTPRHQKAHRRCRATALCFSESRHLGSRQNFCWKGSQNLRCKFLCSVKILPSIGLGQRNPQ